MMASSVQDWIVCAVPAVAEKDTLAVAGDDLLPAEGRICRAGGLDRVADGAAEAGDEVAPIPVRLVHRRLEDHRRFEFPSRGDDADVRANGVEFLVLKHPLGAFEKIGGEQNTIGHFYQSVGKVFNAYA